MEESPDSPAKDKKQKSKSIDNKSVLLRTLIVIILLSVVGFIYLNNSGNKIVQETSDCIKASGKTVKQAINTDSFNGVIVGGPTSNLHVIQGDTNIFEIEARQNIIDLLETTVDEDGILHISYSQCVNDSGLLNLFQKVNYYVSMDQISKLGMNGSGKIINDGQTIISDKLDLILSGSGRIELDLNVVSLTSTNSGSGTIKLSGKASGHTLTLSGSGKTRAYNLITENTNATISGSGTAQVHVTEELASKVAGSGSIDYKGNPKNIK
ncbi:head GIN domain-containing protein [Patescibacteria group bacterium]